MLKGQRVAFVLIILLMLYSIKRNPSEWGADQMCTNTNAQIHEGQRAGRKEGYLIGLYTSTFQRKNRYYLCQQGLRSSYWRQNHNLLGLPVSECCGQSWWEQWFGQVGAPWAGGHVGMGWARRSPQLLPHQPSASWNSEPSWPQACGIVPDWGARCHLGSASAAFPPCRAALGAAAGSRLWFLLGTEQCCQLPVAWVTTAMPALAMLNPNQAGTSPWAGWGLASCTQNQELQVSSKSDKGESHLLLNRWKWLLPWMWAGGATQHLWNKTFILLSLWKMQNAEATGA